MMNNDFIENVIFENEKDTSFINSRDFKVKVSYKYKTKVSSDLYYRIIRYQVNKYGEGLNGRYNVTKDELLKAYHYKRSRKYARKKN